MLLKVHDLSLDAVQQVVLVVQMWVALQLVHRFVRLPHVCRHQSFDPALEHANEGVNLVFVDDQVCCVLKDLLDDRVELVALDFAIGKQLGGL